MFMRYNRVAEREYGYSLISLSTESPPQRRQQKVIYTLADERWVQLDSAK